MELQNSAALSYLNQGSNLRSDIYFGSSSLGNDLRKDFNSV